MTKINKSLLSQVTEIFPFFNFCSLVGSNAEDGVIIVKSLCGIAHVRTCDGVEDIQIVLNVWTFAEARTAKIGQCHDKDLGRKLRKNQGTEKSRSNVKKLHAVWKSANKFRFECHEFRTEDTDAHLCVFKQLFNKLSDMNPVIFSFQIDTDIVMLSTSLMDRMLEETDFINQHSYSDYRYPCLTFEV